MSSFRKQHSVILRSQGQYVEGVYSGIVEASPVDILASVQPASSSDYEKMQSETEGRRIASLFRIFTDKRLTVAGENEMPGDILINSDNERLLLIGKSTHNNLSSPVSHFRYLASKEETA